MPFLEHIASGPYRLSTWPALESVQVFHPLVDDLEASDQKVLDDVAKELSLMSLDSLVIETSYNSPSINSLFEAKVKKLSFFCDFLDHESAKNVSTALKTRKNGLQSLHLNILAAPIFVEYEGMRENLKLVLEGITDHQKRFESLESLWLVSCAFMDIVSLTPHFENLFSNSALEEFIISDMTSPINENGEDVGPAAQFAALMKATRYRDPSKPLKLYLRNMYQISTILDLLGSYLEDPLPVKLPIDLVIETSDMQCWQIGCKLPKYLSHIVEKLTILSLKQEREMKSLKLSFSKIQRHLFSNINSFSLHKVVLWNKIAS
jgi:hypothetical protein